MNAPRYSSPRTCTRCNGTGSVTFTTYAGGFCMGCGGSGWKAGATSTLKTAELADGWVRLTHRAADHRPASWTVSSYSYRADVTQASTSYDSLEAGRAAANLAYRTMVAELAASDAAEADRRAASRAAWAARKAAEAILVGA
jgi:hypothetical protein